jgi:hypothetical protein
MSARFITDSDLNAALEGIFKNAKNQLILISPYIKLHDRLQAILKTRLNDPELFIQVVFGKNEEDPKRSMRKEDLEFFMQFPNIEIRHERRLHAKYYTNDSQAIITSMNLYSYSQDNNIESGILTSVSMLGGLANQLMRSESLDDQALGYFSRVVDQATIIYKKEPEYEKAMFGLTKRHIGSKVVEDKISDFFTSKLQSERPKPSVARVIAPPSVVSPKAPPAAPVPLDTSGYCIRTGVPIPFNVKRPLSDEAYKSWSRYKDENYAERYCHFSGEPSNGETSVAKPVLRKHWKVAKDKFGF